ncbi:MAG: hypothetical protein ACI4OJ_06360, partial [Lachnospiraceae bacterium]
AMIVIVTAEAVLLVCFVYLLAEFVLYSRKVTGTFVERVQRHKGKEGLSRKMQYAARVIYDVGEEHYNACSQDDISPYAGPQAGGVPITVHVNRRHPEKFLIRRNENLLWMILTAALMLALLLFL